MKAHTQKEKNKARSSVSEAVRKGTMTIPDICSECGSCTEEVQAHHPDYNNPLDVMWLCLKCHRKWHRENGMTETLEVETVNMRISEWAWKRLKIRAIKEGKTLMKLLDELSR